ncbi:MAG: bifunctional DNA-binding transcriptional regulator/O6-methylguanine-DNA methyltransferase Ada [Rubripirellula sp.]
MTSSPSNTQSDDRWLAVQERRTLPDSAFVYAVKTTGIYCRPGCASRMPNRENVRFFDNASEASAAGFRPCKRCKPSDDGETDLKTQRVLQACRLIDGSPSNLTLQQLSDAVGLSPTHLHRQFKQLLGVSPKGYSAMKRAARLRTQLGLQSTVTNAVYEAGYETNSRFYADSDEFLGMRPAQYREGGQGVDIHLAFAETSLGWVAVASTAIGVCCIEFGDGPESLDTRVRDLFPNGRITQSSQHQDWVAAVVSMIDKPTDSFSIPLDIQGTAFQRRVWEKIREIGCGQTVTYTELAERIGKPKSARAVANACGANRLAIAIPCHRVQRSDGGSGGYRWGVERKIAIQTKEREATDHKSTKENR